METSINGSGQKFSREQAQAYTEAICEKMRARWKEKVFDGPFMRDLRAGKLPKKTLQLFWQHYYSYPVEINNFHLIIYQRHMAFFTRHPELLGPYVGKISDELVNPRIPGHIQVLLDQGVTFGLTREEMVNCEVFPECRVLTEYARGMVYEGTMIEWWARSLNEEMFGHWSKQWREALLNQYKYKDSELHYFQVHEEADLHAHGDELMAHSEVAQLVFQTMLQDGIVWTRPGWSPEYACLTNADLVGLFHDGIYKHAQELGHF